MAEKKPGGESALAHAFPISPDDDADCRVTRAIYVGNGGALKVTMAGGEIVTFAGIPTGMLLPIAARRVWTASTASGLIGLN